MGGDAIAAWRRFVSCVRLLPPDQAAHLWQALGFDYDTFAKRLERAIAVHHRLVGYDPISENPVDFLELPQSKTGLRTIVHFDKDDPNRYDSYELDHSQVANLLKALQLKMQLRAKLIYFVESYVRSPNRDVELAEMPTLIGFLQSSVPRRHMGQPLMMLSLPYWPQALCGLIKITAARVESEAARKRRG